MTRLNELSEALTQAQLHQLDLQTQIAEANVARNDPTELKRLIERFQLLSQADTNGAPEQEAMSAYQQDRQHLSDLLEDYGPNFVDVQRTERRLGEEATQLTQATENIARTYNVVLQEAIDASSHYVDELQKRVDEERKSVMESEREERGIRAVD